MKRYLSICSLILGLSLLTNSCFKEGDLDFGNIGISDNFTYDLVIPLTDARLSFGQLLKNSTQYVITDENGLLKLVYQMENMLDFPGLALDIPNQISEQVLSPILIAAGDSVSWGSVSPNDSVRTQETFSMRWILDPDTRLDSALNEFLNFRFRIFTYIRNRVRFDITTSNILDSLGRPLTFSELLPGVTSGWQNRNINIDLAKSRVIPDNSDPSNPHKINFNCTITIFRDTLVRFPYTATTEIGTFFENIDVDLAYGYFGQKEFTTSINTVDLPIFDRFPMEFLDIKKADMTLSVTNGLGLPTRLDAEITTLTRNSQGVPGPSKTLLLDDKRLDYPLTPFAPPVVTVFTEEIQDLINGNSGYLPYRVQYGAKVTLNPDHPMQSPNFVSKNSILKVAVGAEIPMELTVGNLVVSDTINFAGLPVSKGIESFTLRANLHNAFPLDATVYLYLMDEHHQIIDSIWMIRNFNETERRPLEIPGAPVGSDGHVINPAVSQLEIRLVGSQIENLLNTQYLWIKGILSTSDWESHSLVSIFENSETEGFLRVMLGARIIVSGEILNSLEDLFDGN